MLTIIILMQKGKIKDKIQLLIISVAVDILFLSNL
jgi:hypothetical protein